MNKWDTLARRIARLTQYYSHEKPNDRSLIQIPCEDSQKVEDFRAGKFLNQLKPFFVSHDGAERDLQPLPDNLQQELKSLWWFDGWVEQLKTTRAAASNKLSFEDDVRLLVSNYTTKRPLKNECILTTHSANGKTFPFNGHAVLEKLAHVLLDGKLAKHQNQVSKEVLHEFFNLAWASEWFESTKRRREISRVSKLVTKSMKIELVLYFFKHKKPDWNSKVDVVIPDGSGQLFHFFPATWLDDISDNWMQHSTPNVVLSEGQKLSIETLTWFKPWIEKMKQSKRRQRMQERKRKMFFEDEE